MEDLKGASSHHVNHHAPMAGKLYWQTGYGALSLGKRNVPWLLRYIEAQEEHHASGTPVARLERAGEEETRA